MALAGRTPTGELEVVVDDAADVARVSAIPIRDAGPRVAPPRSRRSSLQAPLQSVPNGPPQQSAALLIAALLGLVGLVVAGLGAFQWLRPRLTPRTKRT